MSYVENSFIALKLDIIDIKQNSTDVIVTYFSTT